MQILVILSSEERSQNRFQDNTSYHFICSGVQIYKHMVLPYHRNAFQKYIH